MESEQESGEEAAGDDGAEVEDAVQEMDSDLAGMEDSAGDVDSDIDETRSDWERRREDSAVPGAEPPDDED